MPLADLIEQLQQGGSLPPAPAGRAARRRASRRGVPPGVRRSFAERPQAPPAPTPAARAVVRPKSSAPSTPPDAFTGGDPVEPDEPDRDSGRPGPSARCAQRGRETRAAGPACGGAGCAKCGFARVACGDVSRPEGRVHRGGAAREGRLLQDDRRAGAPGRHRRRPHGVLVCAGAADVQGAGREEPYLARAAGGARGGPPDGGGRQHRRAGRPRAPASSPAKGGRGGDARRAGPPEDLKAEAAADPGMQTLLELMPLEIKDIERSMNIQQMMKQAQQMQAKLQKQMAELRVEATAGGGMVTVVMSGEKHLAFAEARPRGRVERRRRDAAGPDPRGGQRRAAQGGRRDVGSSSAA